jgi:two-component system, NarL family, nitrate/nitrite response regulator NarL
MTDEPQPADAKDRGREIVVGILEDDRLLAGALCDFLRSSGFRLEPLSSTVQDFVAALRLKPPDVALVDLFVGEPEGMDLLRLLASSFPTVRSIAMSARPDPEIGEQARAAGAAGFVDKRSSGMEILIEAIEWVSAGKMYFPLPSNSAGANLLAPASQGLPRLTSREREVLVHVSAGADNLKISAVLGITERTVKAHVSALYRKLGLQNRVELALYGLPLKQSNAGYS